MKKKLALSLMVRRIKLTDSLKLEHVLSQQFSNLFNGYAKYFNDVYNRKGSLFMHTYKRIKVEDQNYLLKLVQYIHLNPVETKLCEYPSEWNHSSFKRLVNIDEKILKKHELMSWYNNSMEDFILQMNISKLVRADLQG